VSPAAHIVLHDEALHTWPVAQCVAQAPQWVGSLVRSTHTPPQRI
jgi:hypothetical protein